MLVSRRQDDLPQNRHGGWSSLWLVLTVMLFSSWSAHAASISDYQVDLGPPPSSVGAALVTRPQRDAIALQAAACGQEIDFLRLAIKKSNGEDMAKYLVAKVAWLARGADVCRADVSMPLGSSTIINADWHKSFDETFGCASGPIKSIDNLEPLSAIERSEGVVGFHGGLTKKLIKFEVSSRCMKLQVNAALMRMQVDHQPGTDKLPCHLTDVVQGDWDVTVRDLVRIHHLARNASLAPDQKILEDSTQTHLFNDLLTISGGLWPDDYPISGCGDTERATGSPQDRADERSWAEENFAWLGDIWDVVKWFLLALLIILIIALVLALLFYALGATAGFAVAAWVGVLATGATLLGFVALSMLRAPETENHLLMINTSRYLINEMIIEANPTDVHFYVEDQVEVKKWLLERLQRIATTDFDEYNSRPYQRYSIIALLNLHDFVTCDLQRLGSEKDCDLKTATQIVLDLAAAKFVLGSNEGRRSAPFRRLLEVVADDVVDRHRLTDASAGSDYMFGFMLGHAGHTSQLPEHKAERGAINEMIYPATSRYMPAPAVMSVALGEVGAFEQRIHHDGYEIYSRSPSFLVSAGGVRTPSATPGKLGPFDIGER